MFDVSVYLSSSANILIHIISLCAFSLFLLQIHLCLFRSSGHQRADWYTWWWYEQLWKQWKIELTDSVLKTWKHSTFRPGRTAEETACSSTNQEQGREENVLLCGHKLFSQHFGDASFCIVYNYNLKKLFVCRIWNMCSGLSHGETTQTGQLLCDIQDEEVMKLCWNFPKDSIRDFWKFCRSFYAKWLAVQFYYKACPY